MTDEPKTRRERMFDFIDLIREEFENSTRPSMDEVVRSSEYKACEYFDQNAVDCIAAINSITVTGFFVAREKGCSMDQISDGWEIMKEEISRVIACGVMGQRFA